MKEFNLETIPQRAHGGSPLRSMRIDGNNGRVQFSTRAVKELHLIDKSFVFLQDEHQKDKWFINLKAKTDPAGLNIRVYNTHQSSSHKTRGRIWLYQNTSFVNYFLNSLTCDVKGNKIFALIAKSPAKNGSYPIIINGCQSLKKLKA